MSELVLTVTASVKTLIHTYKKEVQGRAGPLPRQDHTALRTRKTRSIFTPPWEPQFSDRFFKGAISEKFEKRQFEWKRVVSLVHVDVIFYSNISIKIFVYRATSHVTSLLDFRRRKTGFPEPKQSRHAVRVWVRLYASANIIKVLYYFPITVFIYLVNWEITRVKAKDNCRFKTPAGAII
jgi:hypothetical protein